MRRLPVLLCIAIAFWAIPGMTVAEEQSESSRQIDRIEITTSPIFSSDQLAGRRLFNLVDRFHRTTTEDAVRRVLWKREGDSATNAEVEEFEREIRELGVFRDVKTSFDESGTLKIDTRDRVSLYPAILPFAVGGVNGFAAVIVEENLLGNADELFFATAENSDGERETRLSFTDRYIRESPLRLNVYAGTTEEGDSFGLEVSRPFRHLRDNWSWQGSFGSAEQRVDFYEFGESVAEVPRDSTLVQFSLARAYGAADARSQLGVFSRFEDVDYSAAIGPQASTVRVPGDLSRSSIGVFHQLRRGTRFVVEQNIDRLGVDEDLALGWTIDTGISAAYKREVGEAEQWEPGLFANVSWAGKIGDSSFVTLRSSGTVRSVSGSTRGRQTSGEFHFFSKKYSKQIIALNVTFDESLELDDLASQLTLGEDNGLRGYPARQFAGRKRLRVNIEDRIDLDREFFTFRIGGVAFFDAGWIGDSSLGSARTSVGVGLRFGSPEFTGGRVLRLDVAHPLNERTGEDFGTTVSFAVGQVFDFFGSNSSLSSR